MYICICGCVYSRYSKGQFYPIKIMKPPVEQHSPAALPPGKRPGTHCVGGWVGPRAGLHGCGKSFPHLDLIPGQSGLQRISIPTILTL